MAVITTPELPPILFKKNGIYTYVCTYQNKWDPELSRATRILGKNKQLFDALNIPLPEPEMAIAYDEDLKAEAEVQ